MTNLTPLGWAAIIFAALWFALAFASSLERIKDRSPGGWPLLLATGFGVLSVFYTPAAIGWFFNAVDCVFLFVGLFRMFRKPEKQEDEPKTAWVTDGTEGVLE